MKSGVHKFAAEIFRGSALKRKSFQALLYSLKPGFKLSELPVVSTVGTDLPKTTLHSNFIEFHSNLAVFHSKHWLVKVFCSSTN